MNTTIIFVGVVVFSFVVGRLLARYASKLLIFSGVEFLVAGVILGPSVPPRLLSLEVLKSLDLFTSMILGIVGFSVGLAIRRGRQGLEVGLAGAAAAIGVILVVASLFLAVVQFAYPGFLHSEFPLAEIPMVVAQGRIWILWIAPEALWLALTIGSAAAVSSTALIQMASKVFGAKPERIQLLTSLASSGQVTAVIVFGLAMAGSRTENSAEGLGLTLTEWGVVTVAAGTVCGLLFSIFIGREDDQVRINVATVGAVTFAAGIGAALGVSPLLVNLVAGVIVSATSSLAERLQAALGPLRFPSNVLILLLAGANWVPAEGWLWMMPVGYAIIRVIARRTMTRWAVWTFVSEHRIGIGIGRGLIGHGALACAIALSFCQRFPDYASLVLTTVIGGMLLTDIVSMRSLRRYLADVGDITPGQSSLEDGSAPAGGFA